jgi:hypothetical protein
MCATRRKQDDVAGYQLFGRPVTVLEHCMARQQQVVWDFSDACDSLADPPGRSKMTAQLQPTSYRYQ